MKHSEIAKRLIQTGVLPAVMACVLLLVACDRGPAHGPSQTGPPAVSMITVHAEKVMLDTTLPGRTSAFRIAEIRPQVSGLILKRLFTEGTDVKEGQTLYQIDPAPFQAALDNARASLARAQANLPPTRLRVQRYREVLADKAVSQQDYDDAVAALRQAEAEIKFWRAQVKTASINLGYTSIIAPIPGRIGKSNVTEGAVVTAYQSSPLATIQQLDPIYLDVPQSTVDLLKLKQRLKEGRLHFHGTGQDRVKLILEDGTAYPLEGTLQFQDVTVDPSTGTVILRMIFPNPHDILLPGMFVRTVIKEGVNEHAMLIPQQAVSRTPRGEPFVLVVGSNGTAILKMITIDRAIGNRWLVTSGIAPGDRVIREGLQFVRPGMPVKVVSSDSSPPPGHKRPSQKPQKRGGA